MRLLSSKNWRNEKYFWPVENHNDVVELIWKYFENTVFILVVSFYIGWVSVHYLNLSSFFSMMLSLLFLLSFQNQEVYTFWFWGFEILDYA